MTGRKRPFRSEAEMDADSELTALLASCDGGVAVQRFELSPNGLE